MSGVQWDNSRSLEIIRRLPDGAPRKQFLVFVVPDGKKVSPLSQLEQAQRNFDIAARFYRDPSANEGLLEKAEFVMTGGLSKFHAAALFIEQCGLEDAYDGYLFLDGDLEFNSADLSDFLSFVHAAGLDLAQPSLTRDSYCYWKVAYHRPGYLFRETSFVEVMAPYLSRAALASTIGTFKQSISTYGLDLVWPSLVGSTAIAVVDAFQIRHYDKVDHTSGKFYQYLRSIGVDLDEEERLILEHYGVTPEHPHSRRGYFWRRRPLFESQPRALCSVPLDGPERVTERQIYIDILMLLAKRRSFRFENELGARVGSYARGNRIGRGTGR